MSNSRSYNYTGASSRQPLHQHKELYPVLPEELSVNKVDISDSSDELITSADKDGRIVQHRLRKTRLKSRTPKPGFYIPESADLPGENKTPLPYPSHIPVSPTVSRQTVSWETKAVFVAVVIALISGCVGIYYKSDTIFNSNNTQEKSSLEDNFKTFLDRLKLVRREFPSQSDIWSTFLGGIRNVFYNQPPEPSIFLLLHHGEDMTSSCLARKVGDAARNFVNATNPTPLIINGADLNADKFSGGVFIEHFRPLVEQHRILIINNLHSMPASVAKSLHVFCDTVTPLVSEAVYFFTLGTSTPWQEVDSGTPIAEEILNRAWEQLDVDTRQALIVRVTSGEVIKIRPEVDLSSC